MFYLLYVADCCYYIDQCVLQFCIYIPFLHCDRLLEEFENHIEELKQLDEKIQRRVEKLEHQCHREAKEFAHKVQDLQRSNQVRCMVIPTQRHSKGIFINHVTQILDIPFVLYQFRWPFSTSRSSMSISAMWQPRFVTLATSWRG